MIARCDSLPAMPGGLLSTKIETLFACYHDFPDIATFYKSEGGVCAIFSGRATLCGEFDAEELFAFLSLSDIHEIECNFLMINGFSVSTHAVLKYNGCGRQADLCGDISDAYAVLCDADTDFAAKVDRLSWLSDMRRRMNCSRAGIYTRNGSVVIVTAKSNGCAVIGAVACRKSMRGRGSAAALVRDVAGFYAACGMSVLTVSADDALTHYYEKLGFFKTDSLMLLTRDRKSW